MEFLRAARRKSLLSETIYVLLNIALGVAVLGVVWAINSPLPAFALVLLSKWRVLAVRPRYWFAHLQANAVDFIVSISFVVLLYAAGSSGKAVVATQVFVTILYIGWLLVLKPRAKRSLVVAQAAVAVFVGATALYAGAYGWPSSVVVVIMWAIGYSTARHVLAAYSEEQLELLSMVWGLVLAELGWLAYHWTIAYNLPFVAGLELPQVAIIALALSFVAERAYNSFVHHSVVRAADVVMPTLLSLSLIVILLVAFNGVNSGSI